MKKIFDLIEKEEKRQAETLMMIPSENYTYPEVRKAVGSVLMQKYAEGDPGRRYYQGNENIDQIESLCEDLTLKAFGLSPSRWHANVQPHSGCEANIIVYNALLEVGDKILSMYLPDGGHLSHGWSLGGQKVTLVSKVWNVSFYRVNLETQLLDYSEIESIAKKIKPKLIISGGTAYPREIDYRKMAKIAKSVGAYYLADIAHEAGLIAGGAMKSPFPWVDVATFTTHKTLRGPRGAVIICRKELGEKIDRSVIPGVQGGPHMHTIAGIAVALAKVGTREFRKYALNVVKNAQVLAKELQRYGFELVSGGTDKHLILIDLRNKGVSGWFIAWALEKTGIVVNRNTVPNDTGSPFYPSGLRVGTPAVTARGMTGTEMKKIADWINRVVAHIGPREIPQQQAKRQRYLRTFRSEIERDEVLIKLASEVRELCKHFPM